MNGQSSNNLTYMNNPSSEGVIKLRLDTAKLLQDFEFFLTGKKLVPVFNPEKQVTEFYTEQRGKRLINDEGLMSVLMILNNTVNSQGVQGNWKAEYFEQSVQETDYNFSCDLWVNMRRWEVDIENYNIICNAFMNLYQQFASRIIDNKERESYGLSMRTSESVVQTPNRAVSLFGGGG